RRRRSATRTPSEKSGATAPGAGTVATKPCVSPVVNRAQPAKVRPSPDTAEQLISDQPSGTETPLASRELANGSAPRAGGPAPAANPGRALVTSSSPTTVPLSLTDVAALELALAGIPRSRGCPPTQMVALPFRPD